MNRALSPARTTGLKVQFQSIDLDRYTRLRALSPARTTGLKAIVALDHVPGQSPTRPIPSPDNGIESSARRSTRRRPWFQTRPIPSPDNGIESGQLMRTFKVIVSRALSPARTTGLKGGLSEAGLGQVDRAPYPQPGQRD